MDGTAEDYENSYPKFLDRYVSSSLDLLFPTMEWSDEDIVLDIGCGPGKTTKNILLPKCPKVKKIVAIDIVPNYIKYARKTYFDQKIEYKTQDIIQRFDLKEIGKYGKVMSFYALHFVNDFKKLFSTVFSLMKPGGYFFFVFIRKCPMFSIVRELSTHQEWMKYIKTDEILASFALNQSCKDLETEFNNYLSKFNLKVTKSKLEVKDVTFSDEKNFLGKILHF
ncbi:juvenile hormone acid O-methyltransferase-like [Centruroides sculpturatus]|uniref:juvenile hormone acid O-methyltransferase-like n=1 Tax=Centruroides sculpturatus TaxID=218467 RepID=UPI000C6E59EF|nr:juvenile hormone acid O-methyltransferase-like [Centruroides sculpturatus]XP_023211410.1 juvenile hormone acid O-methyltransferase-like [Centruroides sculpturatus]XP_023211411.1 juvenile hormone acid O-methyltransferase-like [Centruroides sculpturatus]